MAQPDNTDGEEKPTLPSIPRTRILVGAAILVLLLVVVGAALALRGRSGDRGNTQAPAGANATVNTATSPALTNAVVYQLPDADRDGLSDAEEERLGTKPDDSDSDADGLYDREEIAYQTDPKQSDTDGDGFSDGDEVRQGFNPKGAGSLLNLSDAVERLKNE